MTKECPSRTIDPTGPMVQGSTTVDTSRDEPRNLAVLALHQIILRVGWIFKTESIIMPAFLDAVGGTAWLRGCVPVLNRFGHSVPPVLVARRLKMMPRKKWALAASTLAMSVPFFLLAGVWAGTAETGRHWVPWVFLALYALFFVVTGITQLSWQTLQGKLIAPTRRGRLLTLYTSIGAPAAILAALLLLQRWLDMPGGGFGYIFSMTALAFVLAGTTAFWLVEPADDYDEPAESPAYHFAAAWRVIRSDADFRRLAVVAALYGTVLMLFPHYQAMGRERLGLSLANLTLWVVVQNAGTGCFSLLAGPLADRRGNRLVLQTAIFACASVPLLAAGLAIGDVRLGRQLFWLVFLPIGLTPVTLKTMANYTLEISPRADHPRYISTMGLCFAAPIVLFSPLVGLLVEWVGYEPVFLGGAVVILLAFALSLRLTEPRHRAPPEPVAPAVAVED